MAGKPFIRHPLHSSGAFTDMDAGLRWHDELREK